MSYIEENGYFIFGDVKSSDYGVWISGGGTFNAPARRYKEYVVPGRNGTLTIDEGAYEEAEVTYPAFIARDFPANVEAFRNAIMAQNGYVRMTDSYHPDEYYLARYMAGLEVDTLPAGRGGSFDLTFRRDPRRFLLSGEESIAYPPGGANSPNLIPYPYYQTTKTQNGITWTDNGDGTITANGTATAQTTFVIHHRTEQLQIVNAGETYTLSGCPSGGSNSTYRISMWLKNEDDTNVGTVTTDVGSGLSLTVDDDAEYYGVYIALYVFSGQTVSNLTFKPMLRLASDTDSKWYPYWDGTKQIYNPTLFASKPLIRVTGDGTVGIGDTTITISPGYEYVDIDSEIQNCYCGLQNANALVSFNTWKFPTLQPGVNGITMSGNVTEVQITPRWFIL